MSKRVELLVDGEWREAWLNDWQRRADGWWGHCSWYDDAHAQYVGYFPAALIREHNAEIAPQPEG
ncbi:MAG: hypothetical protein JWM93_2020 [Frankiales bacterium]|nr:hypothetical protein [Frankiales bacterium]